MTGFMSHDPVVLVVVGRTKHLVVPQLEYGRALNQTTGVRVYMPDHLPTPRGGLSGYAGWAAAMLQKLKIKHANVLSTFPIGVAEELRKQRFKISVPSEPLFPKRAIKTDDEVKKIQSVQRAAVDAVNLVVATLAEASISRSGELKHGGRVLTSERLKAEANKLLIDHACVCEHMIIACGIQAADPHEVGHGPIRKSETVIIDIFPQSLEHGYCGDITRTVIKGPPTEVHKKMYRTIAAAQAASLKKVKAGVAAKDVHMASAETIKKRGFKTGIENGQPVGFYHSTGHGIGLNVHEAPSVSTRPGTLRKGHVITIEPGIYYPEHGGVRIEDTVLVTQTGYKLMGRCSKVFLI
jgi:Xaa-Pro aminopeptidase